jgi:hypothetical protein
MSLTLTRGQQLTLDRLDKEDYKSIKQADVTRLLNKTLDSRVTAEDVIPKVMKYEQVKFPKKSDDEIQKYITKKLKGKTDREMFREVMGGSSDSKGESKIDDYAPSKLGKDGGGLKKPAVPNGSSAELEKLLEQLMGGDETSSDPFAGKGTRVGGDTDLTPSGRANHQGKGEIEPEQGGGGIDFSKFFKEGTQAYAENKETIDKLKNSVKRI